MPAFVATASGRYNLRDKLVFTSDLTFNTVRQALTFNPNEGEKVSATEFAVNLDAFVDLNFGFEFRYNKKLSGFLQLNNILAQQYQRWHNYPVQRFNLMIGVTYSFWRE
jgi:outer membrane receptor protein involved in Fe transport